MRSFLLALLGLALLIAPVAIAQGPLLDAAETSSAADGGAEASLLALESSEESAPSGRTDGLPEPQDDPLFPSSAMVMPGGLHGPGTNGPRVTYCLNMVRNTVVTLPIGSCGRPVLWTEGEALPVIEEPTPPAATAESISPAKNETEDVPTAAEETALDTVPFEAVPPPSEPQAEPRAPHGSPTQPMRQASLQHAEPPGARPLSWALAATAVALPGALLAKLASLLALRRGRRDAKPTLRQDVLDAVARQPGIRHRELVRRIGRGNGTVEHHVRALIAEGKVARMRHGGSTAYFPAGDLSAHQALLRLALQGRTARLLALDVAAHPGSRLTDVARRLGISLATAHYQAGKLVSAGILRDAAGLGRRLEATSSGHECLSAVLGDEAPTPSFSGPPSDGSHLPSLA